MHQCTVVCISIDELCRSSPIPPMMIDNQAYGTKMTYDPAYGPMTTYNEAYGPITAYHNEAYGPITAYHNEAYGPITTYHNEAYGPITAYHNEAYGPITAYNEAYDHMDLEYEMVDDIQHGISPRPSPIPAVESKDQTSSPDQLQIRRSQLLRTSSIK